MESGSARVSRANASPAQTFSVAPKRTFWTPAVWFRIYDTRKVRDRADALANTRDACATRNMAASVLAANSVSILLPKGPQIILDKIAVRDYEKRQRRDGDSMNRESPLRSTL